jgi:hypothetical protein
MGPVRRRVGGVSLASGSCMSAGAVGAGRARNVELGRIVCRDPFRLESFLLFLSYFQFPI